MRHMTLSGLRKKHMAAFCSTTLITALLLSFLRQSLEAGGWTDIRNPDNPDLRALAEFAYLDQRYYHHMLKIRIISAKRQVVAGINYYIIFTVKDYKGRLEKCTTTIFVPSVDTLRKRKVVTKFSCK
ncbi:cystatin-1-like isoform X1 [Dermacentor variabilis]|uniref:cystatin-1-like isoform X1 n=2 Tax=Dermacentor variabilis TaxID=34621 RepID=UPI003F5BD0E4